VVDSRQKGARTETLARDMLRKHTGLAWERVPGSGALDAKHGLKGDLYVPNKNNLFCVEVKGYAEDHINSGLLTHKTPQIIEWWQQTQRQARQVDKLPLLIFKYDRSKLFGATVIVDNNMMDRRWLMFYSPDYEFYMFLLEDWLTNSTTKFVD
jgi:Holliday junction resolvase